MAGGGNSNNKWCRYPGEGKTKRQTTNGLEVRQLKRTTAGRAWRWSSPHHNDDYIISFAALQTPTRHLRPRHIQEPAKDRNSEQTVFLEQCVSMEMASYWKCDPISVFWGLGFQGCTTMGSKKVSFFTELCRSALTLTLKLEACKNSSWLVDYFSLNFI